MGRKRIGSFLLIGVIIAILAYLVLAADSGPTVNSPEPGFNISGESLLINITDSNETAANVTNVTFFFFNGSNSSQLVYEDNLTPRDQDLNTTFNQTIVPLTVLGEGTFNLSFNTTFSNGTIRENRSAFPTSGDFLAVDNTTPTVTINTPSNNTYLKATSQVYFNVTVTNDTGFTDVREVEIWNGSSFNLVDTTVGNDRNATLNASFLTEGANTIRVVANDTANNTNDSTTITVNLDTSAPPITLTRQSTSTESKLVIQITTETTASTCTTDRAGASVTGAGATQTITEGTLAASTSYSYTVTCTDAAGNSNSKTQTFKTDAGTGTSGSGGSGGGTSSGATGQFEKKVWTSLKAGEKATVPVKNGKLGVTEVSFDVKELVYGVWVNIVKKDAFPSAVQADMSKETKVYRRLDISKSISLKDNQLQNAEVKFKVEKSWLSQQNLLSVNVALLHYDDTAKQWKELPTTVASDDGTYVHFVAETPGFSYFAIGSKAEEAAPPAAQEPAETVPAEAPAEEMPAEAAPAEQISDDGTSGQSVLWTLVILVVLGLVAWWLIKRKK